MHDAQLHLRARIHRFDGLRKALQPIHAGDEEILGSAVLQIGQDLQPEFRAFIVRRPKAQDFLVALHVDRDRHVDGPILHVPAFADFDP